MNINPKLWGYHGWSFLYYIILSYPNNPSEIQKNNIYNFFILVGKVLPCEKCRINYANHIIKYPLTDKILSSKQNLLNWFININNEVNILLNKPLVSYNEIINRYLNQNNPYIFNKQLLTIIIIIVLIILFIIILKVK
jgi:hypothetical protein